MEPLATRGPTAAPSAATAVVNRYYQCVDQELIGELLDLFADDVEYARQGTGLIRGKIALRRFYRHDRIIASGAHEIECVLAEGAWVAVRGVFSGVLRSGESVQVPFTDWHRITQGLIDRRESYFPDRQV